MKFSFTNTLLGFTLGSTVGLAVIVHALPSRISEAVNSGFMQGFGNLDTCVSHTKTITVGAPVKGDLIFIEGEILEPVKISECWVYNGGNHEIYMGYLSKVITGNNAKYYVWSKNKPVLTQSTIKGWFAPSSSTYQNTDGQIQMVYPVVDKDMN